MDRRLLDYFEDELGYLRKSGGEFAEAHPKVAGRLGLSATQCADPYVERLLEGLAFLSARVRLKLDAEFPTLTQALLDAVYPNYLAPTPSMCVVAFEPDLGDGALAAGVPVPRGTYLRSQIGQDEQTPCRFRTAHDVTLWPVVMRDVSFQMHGPDRAEMRLGLETVGGIPFQELGLEALDVYFRGAGDLPARLFELVNAHCTELSAGPPGDDRPIDPDAIEALGFDNDRQALFPNVRRSFSGYRLLHEYFAMPERFLFSRIGGLGPAISRCEGTRLEVVCVLSRADLSADADLERAVDASSLALWCTPAINLFPQEANRAPVSDKQREYQVIVDRNRPLDFEVFSLERVTGFDERGQGLQEFHPLFGAGAGAHGTGCYVPRRRPRVLSSRERRAGPRSSYVGSEVFLSLSDPSSPPVNEDVRQLGVRTLATNRDLPLTMPVGLGRTDMVPEASLPVTGVRVLVGPTAPAPSPADGELAWRLVSHLSLNYLSLVNEDADRGASALRGLLELYRRPGEPGHARQIEGLRTIHTEPTVQRAPSPGPIAFVRGLDLTLGFDDAKFEGTTPFVMALVLDRFLARYVSINSFTRTTMASSVRGETPLHATRRGTLEVV